MKKALLTGLLLVYSLGSYANTPSYQQNQMIDTLTKYSVQMLDVGSLLYVMGTNSLISEIRFNNSQLASCLDEKFSKNGYYNFRKSIVRQYVLSNNNYNIDTDMKILTPEVVHYISEKFSQAFSGDVGSLNSNYKPSKQIETNANHLLFNPKYNELRKAVLMPTNVNLNDSFDIYRLKNRGAGGELGMKYQNWAFSQCSQYSY